MFPNQATDADVRINSVSIEADGTARVIWSEGYGMAARAANDTLTLDEMPAGMRTPGTSIIFAEGEMVYGAPLRFLLAGNITLAHDAYRRSRLVDPIPRA
jgi:hypothetical protein